MENLKTLPRESGIYVIKIDNTCYVGQTTDFQSRISQHIRNAYYYPFKGKNFTQKMYWKMRANLMQDIEILMYPSSSNFGIPDFDNKLQNFLSEWHPIGKRVSRNNAHTDETIRIDFAEIYHIIYHFRKYNLTNLEIGGQAAGWASLNVGSQSKIKHITRQTPLKEAYETFMMGPENAEAIYDITQELYADLFSDSWQQTLNSKYVPLIKNSISSNKAMQFQKLLKEAKVPSWSVFFEKKLIPAIEKTIPTWVEKTLKINNIEVKEAGIEMVRDAAKDSILKFVDKEFVQPRKKIANEIINLLFNQKDYSNISISTDNFDFSPIADYITNMILTFIVKVKDSFKLSNNQQRYTNTKSFKPVRASAVWHFSQKSTRTTISQWLQNMSIGEGQPVEKEWLKHRSYLLFDYLASKAVNVNFMKADRHVLRYSLVWKSFYYAMYSLKPNEWLSSKMRLLYKKHAPAYLESWWKFYRPMVTYWRKAEGFKPFETTEDKIISNKYKIWKVYKNPKIIEEKNIKIF